MKSRYKNIVPLLFLLLNVSIIAQVTPNLIVENKTHTSGVHDYCSNGGIISPSTPSSPVSISGTAQVHYTAGQYVRLEPGFSASSLTGSTSLPTFTAKVNPPAFPVVVLVPNTTPTTQVGQYDKLELGLDLPSVIDNLVTAYFTNNVDPAAVNPFNPEDISIVASFGSPTGTGSRDINGFYMEPFTYSTGGNPDWQDVLTEDYNFRVRFAPTQIGQWSCTIRVFSPNGKFPPYNVNCVDFTCVPSDNKGYLEVGTNKRQLRFSGTHESFFAIGQNIPWLPAGEPFNNQFLLPPFTNYYNEVKNLGDNQGNFVRLIMRPGGHGIEYEKLGDYGKTDQNPKESAVPPDVGTENRQHNAFELDNVFDVAEQKGVYILLDLEAQTNFNAANNEIPINYLWGYNCYKTQIPGITNPLDLLTNTEAKKYFKRRLQYIIARWGYSTSLGVIELLSEQDGWDGYVTSAPGVTPVTYSASAEVDSYHWHDEMVSYIKSTLGEQNHLLSTSYSVRESGNVFANDAIDVSSGHSYGSNRAENYEVRYSYMNANSSVSTDPYGLLIAYNKPSIFGETGMMNATDYSTTPPSAEQDINDIEGCNDVSFHNALWSTAFMGCYGTGLNWWQTSNDAYRVNNFPPLRSFFDGIDFENNNFIYPTEWRSQIFPWTFSAEDNAQYELFSLHTHNKEKMIGWAHNATYWWGNIDYTCIDTHGHGISPEDFGSSQAGDDDTNWPLPAVTGDKVEIKEVQLLKKYDVDWYYTTNIGTLGSIVVSQTKYSSIFGHLNPYYPETGPSSQYDYAFKAQLHSLTHAPEDLPPTIDTLLCDEDSIVVDGTYGDDVNGVYSYHWNFGNGQTSILAHPTIVYSHPGIYNVTLSVTDTTGTTDSVSQKIVVLDCQIQNTRSLVNETNNNNIVSSANSISIQPNPNNGEFTIVINNFQTDETYIVEIINSHGKLISSFSSNKKELNVNLSTIENGLYILKVNSNNSTCTQKFIKQ